MSYERGVLKRVGDVAILIFIGLGFALVGRLAYTKAVAPVESTQEGRCLLFVYHEGGPSPYLSQKIRLDCSKTWVYIVCGRREGAEPKTLQRVD